MRSSGRRVAGWDSASGRRSLRRAEGRPGAGLRDCCGGRQLRHSVGVLVPAPCPWNEGRTAGSAGPARSPSTLLRSCVPGPVAWPSGQPLATFYTRTIYRNDLKRRGVPSGGWDRDKV
nr:uncharacterized protein LOC129531580 [Gorilla gorilla gorilla]